MSTRGSVLVVDDHVEMARLLSDQLGDAGFEVEIAAGGAKAIALAKERLPDVVITDLRMEKVDGFDVLEQIHAIDPGVPVLIMTAYGNIESAIDAIKRGASHYITKPFRLDEVLVYVERALVERRLRKENRELRQAALGQAGFGTMVGRSDSMRKLFERVGMVAKSSAPVLVRGESGTGKELVARALHNFSSRKDQPFLPVNCTALPEALLESELFGHVKGAYTGAMAARRGLFAEADGGTLFLDEIGDMPTGLQSKLLRVLEDGEVRAIGSDTVRKVNVRMIAATHQDLEQRMREGAFRQDLFYRINVVQVVIPPLRDRPEDIALLVEHFLSRAKERNPHAMVKRFSAAALAALGGAAWPGNVRELENVIERLVIVTPDEEVHLADLEANVPGLSPLAGGDDASPLAGFKQRMPTIRQLEGEYIAWVVTHCGGNKTRAAEILGIDVSTIHRRERG